MIDLKKKYKTKDGREVRLFGIIEENPNYQVFGAILVDGEWDAREWTIQGAYYKQSGHNYDLVEVKPPIMLDCWINVYDDGNLGYLYHCREEADNCSWKDRIACINIKREVKEGEGLND